MLGQLLEHHAVGIGEAHRLHHKHNHVHTADGFGYIQIQAVVERIAVVGLKTGRVDKHKLRRVIGINTGYFVPRGLRFLAGDADFLAD